MPDTRLLFSIALAVLFSHHVLGCPAFTSCQTRMAAALSAPGADTVRLCRALRDYLVCTRRASASCGVSERGYVAEAFNIVNVRYSTLCSAFHTISVSATVDATTANTAAPSSATSTVSSATTLTSVEGEKTTPEADLLPQNRSATLPPVPSYLPEVTSDYTSPKDQVTTLVTSATTEQMSIATKRDGSACIYLPGVAKQSSEQLCTVRQIMSQFNSGCRKLDVCGEEVYRSLSSPNDTLICGSLVSYKTCAQKAKRECGNGDDSDVQQSVTKMYTNNNCTAILKEITTSVEMSPVTARNSVSAPTRGILGTGETSKKPESSSSTTDTTSYILNTDGFKVTNTPNADITSTQLKYTNTPTMSFERTNRLEVTNTKNTAVTTTQLLKGTSTPPVTSALTSGVKDTDALNTERSTVSQVSLALTSRVKDTVTHNTERSTVPQVSSTDRHTHVSSSTALVALTSRVKDTDTHNTERSTVPQVSSTDRHTHVSSSTALNRETTTEVKTNAPPVTSSSTRYLSSSSEPAVVRRDRSSTLRVTEVPLAHTDDSTVPTSGVDMTTTKNKTPFKTNLWTSLVTNTRTSRVTSPSILPGQPTEATSGFHQSRKPFPKSTDHTGHGTRSSIEMKKTSPSIPGKFPTIPPPEEEESTRDTSQGVGFPSSATNRSLAVSTVSTVLVSWICWTLYITIT